MLIHTAIKNGNIPSVRGVTGLPGAMSGCGATCTSRDLPGVVGIPGGSKVARWKAMITAVILMYLYWPKSVGGRNTGMFPLVLDSEEFSARSCTFPGPIVTCHGTNQRRCNQHDSLKRKTRRRRRKRRRNASGREGKAEQTVWSGRARRDETTKRMRPRRRETYDLPGTDRP